MRGIFKVYRKVYKASGVYMVIYPHRKELIKGEIIDFNENLLHNYVKAGDKVWIKKEHLSTIVSPELLWAYGEKRPIRLDRGVRSEGGHICQCRRRKEYPLGHDYKKQQNRYGGARGERGKEVKEFLEDVL